VIHAYWKEYDRKFLEPLAGATDQSSPSSPRPLSASSAMINRAARGPGRAATRLSVVNQLWGFAKVRYRGLAKNRGHARRPVLHWPTSTKSADTASSRGRSGGVRKLHGPPASRDAIGRTNHHSFSVPKNPTVMSTSTNRAPHQPTCADLLVVEGQCGSSRQPPNREDCPELN